MSFLFKCPLSLLTQEEKYKNEILLRNEDKTQTFNHHNINSTGLDKFGLISGFRSCPTFNFCPSQSF